ncbi:MAG: hypothetical protein HC895_12415 [Leptolyngbyaceae cyanobacterium SM1_3_5]|nr:hypothetical protein [Leptolyngbyaceae cyanobacterium SM1_3_5]
MLDSAPASASSAAVNTAIDRLRHLSQCSLQAYWGCNNAIVPLNERGHIAWEAGEAIELYQTIVIPERLNGYPVLGMEAASWPAVVGGVCRDFC